MEKIPEEQKRYEDALKNVATGLITKEEFMLIEAEFREWSKNHGQQLNG